MPMLKKKKNLTPEMILKILDSGSRSGYPEQRRGAPFMLKIGINDDPPGRTYLISFYHFTSFPFMPAFRISAHSFQR